jgi:hypothetical protein
MESCRIFFCKGSTAHVYAEWLLFLLTLPFESVLPLCRNSPMNTYYLFGMYTFLIDLIFTVSGIGWLPERSNFGSLSS